MRYVLAAILLIVIVIILLLVCKTTVRIVYRDEILRLYLRVLCFRYTYDSSRPPKKKKEKRKKELKEQEISSPKEEKNSPQAEEKSGEKKSIGYWIAKLKEYYALFCDATSVAAKVLGALRYKIQVRAVVIEATYGTGDAAKTGMAYGGAWAAVSQLYMLLSQYLIFDYPRLELTPVFDQKCFLLAAEGIICFRPVHIIKAAVIGFAAYCKRLPKRKKKADE